MMRVAILSIICLCNQVYASPKWIWENDFTENEQHGLISWIEHAGSGITSLFGHLPYEYRVHIHRMNEGRGPCPWAHTSKGSGRAVHFYVNTSYSWNTFKKDWTAPHELSHLMFPYLGQGSMWFSEGIASYLQYQIMYANKTISWSQGASKLQERFERARMHSDYDDISIVDLSNITHETGDYVRLYWGGAAYFLNVDYQLYQEKKLRLNDIIREYLKCCSQQRNADADSMMQIFNKIAETDIFTSVYNQTVSQQDFPDTHDALVWLINYAPSVEVNY